MSPNILLILAIIFSASIWTVDAMVDVFIFKKNGTVIENILSTEPAELWMRILMVTLFLFFALLAKHLLKKQIEASKKLSKYKDIMEEQIHTRTKDLQEEIKARIQAQKKLELIATTDPLTSLFNRRKFSELLKYELEKERRYGSGLFLMDCTIDDFKSINNTFGNNVGDAVLKQFSSLIQDAIRTTDIVARWSGDKFVFLFTNTDVNLASTVANKVRSIIELYQFPKVGRLTASFGVAVYSSGKDNEETLMLRAEKALHAARQSGSNKVEIYLED